MSKHFFIIRATSWENLLLTYPKTDADQLPGFRAGFRAADQFLSFSYMDISFAPLSINLKFQASLSILLLYSLVCVGSGRDP